MISSFFDWCVLVLEIIGKFTGLGYEVANILIFCNNSAWTNNSFLFTVEI